MEIRRIAAIGCGRAGSAFVAGIAAGMPEAFQLTVYVPNEDSKERASARVASGMRSVSPEASVERVIFSTEPVVSADTQLIIVQLPSQLNRLFGNVPRLEMPEARASLLGTYMGQLAPEAVVFHYSAAFEETGAVGGDGVGGDGVASQPAGAIKNLIHFSNPAYALPLLEMGMPNASAEAYHSVKVAMSAAGFYPMMQRSWKPGFFSTRFQVRLLMAVETIRSKTGETWEGIDDGIRTIVIELRDCLQKGGGCGGGGLFTAVRQRIASLLDAHPSFDLLWQVFAITVSELQSSFSEGEIAIGLLAGPALRCINPGFLKTVDIEGVTQFLGLAFRLLGDVDLPGVEGLIIKGRIGGPPYGEYVPDGFFDWNEITRRHCAELRDTFLLENRVTWD